MEPVGRRGFTKTLGLLGLLSIGVEGYQEATKVVYRGDEFPTKDLEKQLEAKPVLQLVATYGTPKPKPAYSMNQYYMVNGWGEDYVEDTKKEVSVQIVPGPDGKLYVKENDTWRKL